MAEAALVLGDISADAVRGSGESRVRLARMGLGAVFCAKCSPMRERQRGARHGVVATFS